MNSVFDKPGTFVKPQIALALVAMCYEAGAREIVSLEDVSGAYWRRATLSKEHAEMVQTIRGPKGKIAADIKGGVRLTSVEVTRDLLRLRRVISTSRCTRTMKGRSSRGL